MPTCGSISPAERRERRGSVRGRRVSCREPSRFQVRTRDRSGADIIKSCSFVSPASAWTVKRSTISRAVRSAARNHSPTSPAGFLSRTPTRGHGRNRRDLPRVDQPFASDVRHAAVGEARRSRIGCPRSCQLGLAPQGSERKPDNVEPSQERMRRSSESSSSGDAERIGEAVQFTAGRREVEAKRKDWHYFCSDACMENSSPAAPRWPCPKCSIRNARCRELSSLSRDVRTFQCGVCGNVWTTPRIVQGPFQDEPSAVHSPSPSS